MEKRSHINWFLSELPKLRADGVIEENASAQLEQYYKDKLETLPAPQKIFSLVIGVIGVIMVAAGIILFFNHNWDIFPKFLRIGISALPLALGAVVSYWTLCREKGQLWKECSAVLTSTGTAVLIALLSQIYQLHGELHEFMFFVLLLAIPVLYIFNSIGLAALYVFFSFFINNWDTPCWWNAVVIFAFCPFLFWHLREKSLFCVWSRYLAVFSAVSLAVGCGRYMPALAVISLSSLFFIAGLDLLSKKQHFFSNPWFVPAFAVQCVMLGIGSSTENFFKTFKRSPQELWIWWIFFGIVLLLVFYVLSKKHLTAERLLPFVLILLTLIPLVIEVPIMRVVYNIYLGAAGIIFLRNGFAERSVLLFNAGVVMLAVLLTCRFFDADIGLLYRSLGFVLLGSGFIFANVIYNKKSQRR